MRMRLPTVSDAYRLAWLGTRRLPAPVGYGLAHTVADSVGLVPSAALHHRCRTA